MNNNNQQHLVTLSKKVPFKVNKKQHDENMKNKVHSIHCIIHKNLKKYTKINQNNHNSIQNHDNERYACDFRHENLCPQIYIQLFQVKCEYFNPNYVQYEEQAIYDLAKEFFLP